MPLYIVRDEETGAETEIDTRNGWQVLPPSKPGALCDLKTWGRPDSLTADQCGDLAEQDFKARTVRSCANCFMHGKRQDIGPCDRLCCALRAVGLEAGVEVSPYVTVEPPPPPAAELPPGCFALKYLVGWGGLLLFWRENLRGLLLTVAALCACGLLLIVFSAWQNEAAEEA